MQHCFRVGLYYQGITRDLSKFSPVEFLAGARYFQGNRSPNEAERLKKGYSAAWLHHKGRNKHHLEYWQVSAEEVLRHAIEYTREKKGVWFKTMSEVLKDIIFEEDGVLYERARDGMFVLTNKEKYLGAVLAYFPDILYDISTRLKEDFYMLPASVHEWVIVPDSQVEEEEVLFLMVKDINDREVLEEEVLSYNVYYYSMNSQKIHICKSKKVKNY